MIGDIFISGFLKTKNVWVNIAGHIAGLRAETSTNRNSWWASAGLERGQLKGILKLAFNPNNAQRDILYKNGLNPIVSFAGLLNLAREFYSKTQNPLNCWKPLKASELQVA